MQRPISMLIVDDHPLFRDGLVQLLSRQFQGIALRCASTAAQALAMLRESEADVALVDWRLADGNGLDLLVQIQTTHPTVAAVLCSGADDYQLAKQAQRAGLMGFLPKTLSPQEVKDALEKIFAGDTWFPSTPNPKTRLTAQQLRILESVATGASNKAIARQLDITERTVKFHLAAAFERLGTKKRTEAVTRAVQLDLIGLPIQPTATTDI